MALSPRNLALFNRIWLEAKGPPCLSFYAALDRLIDAARAEPPEGYVIVPASPTKAMLHAAAKAMSPDRRPTPERVSVRQKHTIRYLAMVAAAPVSEPPHGR